MRLPPQAASATERRAVGLAPPAFQPSQSDQVLRPYRSGVTGARDVPQQVACYEACKPWCMHSIGASYATCVRACWDACYGHS